MAANELRDKKYVSYIHQKRLVFWTLISFDETEHLVQVRCSFFLYSWHSNKPSYFTDALSDADDHDVHFQNYIITDLLFLKLQNWCIQTHTFGIHLNIDKESYVV